VKKILVIARWEYVERVKSKMFLVSLLLMPLLMLSMGILPGMFAGGEDSGTRVIGVIDLYGNLTIPFADRLQHTYMNEDGNALYVVRPLTALEHVDLETARQEADAIVRTHEIDGYCLFIARSLGGILLEYRSNNPTDFHTAGRIEETVRSIVFEQTLARVGLKPQIAEELKSSVTVRTSHISGDGTPEMGFLDMFFSAYVFLMMLFFMILSSGQLLVRSVIEEKSNRIVELLVSSCSSTELMAGKVLGLSGLGFTQMAVWGLIGLLLSATLDVPPVQAGDALLFVLYFILGYLLYAAIFIGVGSPASTEQEAQQLTGYLVFILVVPLVLTIPAIQHPDATWISVLTYFPLLTPTMMALRLSIGSPSLWEILLTVAIMLVSIYGAMVAAGRIFRIAILSTGKRPGLGEILRWARGE